MALREIVLLGDPRLREEAQPVTAVDEPVRELIRDMFETMHQAPGIGLAATQIGVPRRVVVVSIDDESLAFVNPEIVERSAEEETEVEACLSLPGVQGMVTRAEAVVVRALDENGEEFEVEGDDLFARCIQHEIDHLDGVVFLDRVTDEKVRWIEDEEDAETGQTERVGRLIPREEAYARFGAEVVKPKTLVHGGAR